MVRLLPRLSSLRKSKAFASRSVLPPLDESAKVDFAILLNELLERPEGSHYTCGCCGHVNELQNTERLNSNCLFSQLQLNRFRCGECGLIFGPVQLIEATPQELGGLYACLYRFYREGYSQPFQEKTFYLMNPSRRGEYLNYACGDWTEGVERLRSLGWQVWGFEPFQQVASQAIVTRQDMVVGKQYDGLMSHNYIEHVQDPVAFFNECSDLIVPGGTMAHSSACFDYVFEVSPFHLFFYCGESVQRLAARTGFRVLAEHRVDQDFPGYQYVCCLLQKNGS
jgi:hypothetical protein